jgi:GDP-D-mannose dehydratase
LEVGWEAKITFDELVKEMVEADLKSSGIAG